MEKYRYEQAQNLQQRLDSLDNMLVVVQHLEPYDCILKSVEGSIDLEELPIDEEQMENLRDILITSINRAIVEVEREFEEV